MGLSVVGTVDEVDEEDWEIFGMDILLNSNYSDEYCFFTPSSKKTSISNC
ncbi:MAG: hypothetical protein CM15mP4_3830 [Candidatus Neomarinimicrobiota bacterium]|nr:MAG: hypothetical protein CM15mP4_3830 [Candidatus Neomarinimicrobiota bacterium]